MCVFSLKLASLAWKGSPLRYVVKLSNTERARLAALKGREILTVINGGWDVLITTDQEEVQFIPKEVVTPDIEHPLADVVRPSIALEPQSQATFHGTIVARDLGVIETVSIWTSLITSSPVREAPATQILGVEVPAGLAYGHQFHNPEAGEEPENSERSVVLLDVAVVIQTLGHVVAIYSNGVGFFMHVTVDSPVNAGWATKELVSHEELDS